VQREQQARVMLVASEAFGASSPRRSA